MKQALTCSVLLLAGLGLSIMLMWGIAAAEMGAAQSERYRGASESAIIRAQSQARMDAAVVSQMEAETAARREQAKAEAAALVKEAEARALAIDRESQAHTQAMLAAAALPWGALAIVGALGLAVVLLAGAILVISQPPTRRARIIERQIVYLPPPGMSRHQTWEVIVSSRPALPAEVYPKRRAS